MYFPIISLYLKSKAKQSKQTNLCLREAMFGSSDLRLGCELGMWITIQAIDQLLAYCYYVNAWLLCIILEFSIDLTFKNLLE